jgi:hypothetical protein
MKNLSKEEFVHILRRQSTGFSRGSSKYRGVTLHKCGRWEARMGQFLGKKWEHLKPKDLFFYWCQDMWLLKLDKHCYTLQLDSKKLNQEVKFKMAISKRKKRSGNTFSDYQVYLSWIIRQRSRSCKVLVILNLFSSILIVTNIRMIFKS